MFTIEMLDAYEGDALWIEYGAGEDVHRVLIDAGRKETYRDIVERIEATEGPLDLFVITHIDDDHIFGALPLLADGRVAADRFRDVWYNGYTQLDPAIARRPPRDVLGAKKGEIFAGLLLQGGFPWNNLFDDGRTAVVEDEGELPWRELAGGMRLTLLSPRWHDLARLRDFWDRTLEDMEPGDAAAALALFEDLRSVQPDVLGGSLDIQGILDDDDEKMDDKEPNGSSIAFLAEWDGRRVLFTGDAHPPVLEGSIRRLLEERGEGPRLRLDAFKVSHHGSKKNTSRALLDLIDCDTFLISTSGSRHHHPDKQALARIVDRFRGGARPTRLFFNHRSDETQVWDDPDAQDAWNYRAYYPPAGCLLDLGSD